MRISGFRIPELLDFLDFLGFRVFQDPEPLPNSIWILTIAHLSAIFGHLKFLDNFWIMKHALFCYWRSYVASVVQVLDFWLTWEYCMSAKSLNEWSNKVVLMSLFKNPLKIANFEKRPKTSRYKILDFWLTLEFRVSAKSLTTERLKLCYSVTDIKCLFYYLKIL